MPMICHKDYVALMKPALNYAVDAYVQLITEFDVPPQEARQVLPNACAVNILWTVNVRSLINFFDQRLCKRNVAEMLAFAQNVWGEFQTYWPEMAEEVGPACYVTGKCNQGTMSCHEPIIRGPKS